MALYVTAVDENSPAERFGLTVGCALLAIDGHPLNDALDYQFYTTPTSFSLEVCENEQHRTDISDIQHTLVKVAFKCFHCPTPYGISTYISPVTQSTVT